MIYVSSVTSQLWYDIEGISASAIGQAADT